MTSRYVRCGYTKDYECQAEGVIAIMIMSEVGTVDACRGIVELGLGAESEVSRGPDNQTKTNIPTFIFHY